MNMDTTFIFTMSCSVLYSALLILYGDKMEQDRGQWYQGEKLRIVVSMLIY